MITKYINNKKAYVKQNYLFLNDIPIAVAS